MRFKKNQQGIYKSIKSPQLCSIMSKKVEYAEGRTIIEIYNGENIMNNLRKAILIIFGSFFILLGFIGIFLPLLPTTPFILLGAACYIKGSQKLYDWLINNKLFGIYIKHYYDGKGIALNIKLITIAFLWTSIIFSVVFVVPGQLFKIILLFIAVGVTWHIISIKSKK